MSCDLSSPELSSSYNALKIEGRAVDWFVAGYRNTRDKLFLYRTGNGGLDEMTTEISSHRGQPLFGSLKMEGRILSWSYLPEETVSGVRRARALVHSRAIASHFPGDASLTASKMSDFTTSFVRQKLRLDGTSSLPPSPAPPQTPEFAASVFTPTGGEDDDRPPVPEKVPSPLMNGFRTFSVRASSPKLSPPGTPNLSHSGRTFPAGLGLDHPTRQSAPPPRTTSRSGWEHPASTSAATVSEFGTMPSISGLPYLSASMTARPTSPASLSTLPEKPRPSSLPYDLEERRVVSESSAAMAAAVSQQQKKEEQELVERQRRDQEAAERERESEERENNARLEREKREREAAELARENAERETQARREAEERKRERLDREEREKLEMEEREQRRDADRLMREEQRRLDENQRLEDEKMRKEREEREAAEEEEMKLMREREALMRRLREEEEARKREEARLKVQLEMRQRFLTLHRAGQVMLSGWVTCQGSGTVYWKRRFFQLDAQEFRLYKSETDTAKPVETLVLPKRTKAIRLNPEEASFQNSFKMTFRDEDEDEGHLFYTDDKDDLDLLLAGLRMSAGLPT